MVGVDSSAGLSRLSTPKMFDFPWTMLQVVLDASPPYPFAVLAFWILRLVLVVAAMAEILYHRLRVKDETRVAAELTPDELREVLRDKFFVCILVGGTASRVTFIFNLSYVYAEEFHAHWSMIVWASGTFIALVSMWVWRLTSSREQAVVLWGCLQTAAVCDVPVVLCCVVCVCVCVCVGGWVYVAYRRSPEFVHGMGGGRGLRRVIIIHLGGRPRSPTCRCAGWAS